MRIGIKAPATLDPPLIRDPAGLLIGRQIFEPLVSFNPRTLKLEAALAEKWEVLDGGSRFLFRLRNGAKFHDGSPVTADDVRFSLNRLARKDTASEVAFLLDQVVGFNEVNQDGSTPELAGIRTVDAQNIEITLIHPWIDFPYVLTHPSTAATPKRAIEADVTGFKAKPIGSGPYRLARPLSKNGGSLLRVKDHARSPRISRVDLVVFEQAKSGWESMTAGALDISEAPSGRIRSARARYGDRGFRPLAAGLYLGFNLSKVADLNLRRAVSLAIDRSRISQTIYEGTLLPASGLTPPGMPGRAGDACGGWCRHDPNAAKELITNSFPQGPPLMAFDYQSGPLQEALARAVQADLEAVGIKVEPRPRELTQFFELLDKREQDVFRLGWVAEYPLMDWFVSPLFRSGASDNHTSYSVPEVDDLLTKARSAPAAEDREELYGRVERRVMQDLPVIPIGHFRSRYVAQQRVSGFYVDNLGGFEFHRMRLV